MARRESKKKRQNKIIFITKANIFVSLFQIVCILGIFGCMRGCELVKLRIQDEIEQGNLFQIWIIDSKSPDDRYFTIHGPSCNVLKKYIRLRPADIERERFLLSYYNGRCTNQVIGKDKFEKMPFRIAEFSGLPDAERYTGHSFRRSSASLFANTGAGIDAVMNLGGWKSAKVAKGYIENPLAYKNRTSGEADTTSEEEKENRNVS